VVREREEIRRLMEEYEGRVKGLSKESFVKGIN
jgi:hypothetical protein